MDQINSFSDSYEGVELFDSIYIPALISDEFLEAISNMCIMVFHYFCVNVLYQMKPMPTCIHPICYFTLN
jgi:hypothetical protein